MLIMIMTMMMLMMMIVVSFNETSLPKILSQEQSWGSFIFLCAIYCRQQLSTEKYTLRNIVLGIMICNIWEIQFHDTRNMTCPMYCRTNFLYSRLQESYIVQNVAWNVLHFGNKHPWFVLWKAFSGLLLRCQSISSQYCFMLPFFLTHETNEIRPRKWTASIWKHFFRCDSIS